MIRTAGAPGSRTFDERTPAFETRRKMSTQASLPMCASCKPSEKWKTSFAARRSRGARPTRASGRTRSRCIVDADQQCNMADAGHANHHPHDLSLVRAPASSPVDAPHSTAATWKHTVRPDHEARASTPPPSERLQPRPRDGAGGSGRDGDNTKFEAKLKEKAEKGKGRLERGYDRASRPQGRRRSTTKRKTCCSPDRGEEDKEAHGIEGTSADVAEVKARLARKKEIVAEHAAATLACLSNGGVPPPGPLHGLLGADRAWTRACEAHLWWRWRWP